MKYVNYIFNKLLLIFKKDQKNVISLAVQFILPPNFFKTVLCSLLFIT